MIITVTPHMFRDAFMDSQYRNNFSGWALDKLYGYLGEYESSTGEQVELDCTAIACDYTEATYLQVLENYSLGGIGIKIVERLGLNDSETPRPAEDIIEDVRCWLEYRTTVVAQNNEGTFLFAEF
jgi:hypothetical protein